MPKRCLLQVRKMNILYKSLTFNILTDSRIIRVFAPEGESVRNTRLFFGVEPETQTRKPEYGYKLNIANIGFIL